MNMTFDDEAQAQEDASSAALDVATRKHQLDDLRKLMAMPEGRRVFQRLLDHTQMNGAVFDVNPTVMAYREGMRNEGRFLTQELMLAAPKLYMQMLAEYMESFTNV